MWEVFPRILGLSHRIHFPIFFLSLMIITMCCLSFPNLVQFHNFSRITFSISKIISAKPVLSLLVQNLTYSAKDNYSCPHVLAALLCESQSKARCQSLDLISSAFIWAPLFTEWSFFSWFLFLSSNTLVKNVIFKFLPKHLVFTWLSRLGLLPVQP